MIPEWLGEYPHPFRFTR